MKSIVLLLALAFCLSACNTVRGVGQDLEVAGEKIKDAAKK